MNDPTNEHHDHTEANHPRRPTLESLGINTENVNVRFRLNYGLDHHQGAFAAYLKLEDVDPYAMDLVDHFERDFLSGYSSPEDCCDHQLEMLGWTDNLNHLKTTEGIPDELLQWNYAALWEQINDVWSVVEYDKRFYLFAR